MHTCVDVSDQIGKCKVKLPPGGGGLHPAVGMHSEGEEVQLHLDADWVNEESMLMAVDHCEDDWKRLHDIRLCGQVGVRVSAVLKANLFVKRLIECSLVFV